MKKGSTLFLKGVLVIIGLIVLALCIFSFPDVGRGLSLEFPKVPYLQYFIVILYGSVVPFYFALYQAWKLLVYIDKNTAFSTASVQALRTIKHCAAVICFLWLAAMPWIYGIAEVDDAPGLILFGLFIAGAPLVVAVFSAVLEKLVRNAMEIKSENDLTV
jgi:hypothetical protein